MEFKNEIKKKAFVGAYGHDSADLANIVVFGRAATHLS
jgi:hypothetical protein